MAELYIGLMAGTSTDGIDAALVDFSQTQPAIVATHYMPYPPNLREQILALCQPGHNEIQRLGELDVVLGKEFAHATNQILQQQQLSPASVRAIGSHGQTIRHHPHSPNRFTMQIGDPNTIAALTGITVVADFRRRDMAVGGQGAPLVPAFHQCVFASSKMNRAIVNIGGIANITVLANNTPEYVLGYDTGPGNVLLDAWIHQHLQKSHDKEGAWGAGGQVHQKLLASLLSDNYFNLAPPKSTGREHFNLAWLQQHIKNIDPAITPIDVQATLVELTASSILSAIRKHIADGEIMICGGGAHNAYLMTRLQVLAQPNFSVASTAKYGVEPDWVEAMAFAWLARQTMRRQPGNLPSVTGANQAEVLGGVYYCS